MPNIENISVRSTTLKPNGILIGGVTSNNGVLSFVANSYFEIPYQKQATMTYVVKFTTPSAYPTNASRFVIHSEWFESVGLSTAGDLYVTDWTINNRTLVSGIALNSTYWLKAVITPSLRTYYISTDGATFNQVDSYAPTGVNVNFDSIFMLGNNSMPQNYAERFWTGTIDLNGCYIEVGGDVVWQGMDYNNIQRIGGDEFDGQWVKKGLSFANGVTIAPNGSFNYSIATYLGDNTHDYEVEFELYVETGTTSGNCGEFYLYAGNATSNVWNTRACRLRTRAAATQIAAGTFILPILKSAQSVTIWAHNSSTVGNCKFALGAVRYRRIGLNDTHSNYISAIDAGGSQYDIQGNFLNGDWVSKDTQLYNGTIAASASQNCSLSSYLPNDGYSYEVLFTLRADTGTTSGNAVTGRVGYSSTATSNGAVCRQNTRTASNMTCCGNIMLPVSARNIYVSNTAGVTSGTMVLTARGYRRIGTNG